MQVFAFESGVLGIAGLVLLALKVWMMVDAVTRRPDAFVAADKKNKALWLWLLGLGLVASIVFFSPISILSLAGTIAALVYLLDVRPALAEVTRR